MEKINRVRSNQRVIGVKAKKNQKYVSQTN
jgi:hypothetical protein